MGLKRFLLLLIIAALIVISLFNPILAGYALAGIAVSLTVRYLNRITQKYPVLRAGLFIIVGLILIAFLLLFFGVVKIEWDDGTHENVLSASYTAYIKLNASRENWEIEEVVWIPPQIMGFIYSKSVKNAAPVETLNEKQIVEFFRDDKAGGWKTSILPDGTVEVVKRSSHRTRIGKYSISTVNELPLLELKQLKNIFVPESVLDASVEVPRNMVLSTFPESTVSEDMLKGNKEAIYITLPYQRNGGYALRIKLLNPVLWNLSGSNAAKATFWPPLKWLIMALFAVIGRQAEKIFVDPLFARLVGKMGVKPSGS